VLFFSVRPKKQKHCVIWITYVILYCKIFFGVCYLAGGYSGYKVILKEYKEGGNGVISSILLYVSFCNRKNFLFCRHCYAFWSAS
jgi:hypothetical protein